MITDEVRAKREKGLCEYEDCQLRARYIVTPLLDRYASRRLCDLHVDLDRRFLDHTARMGS